MQVRLAVSHSSIRPLSLATATALPSEVAQAAIAAVGLQSKNLIRCSADNPVSVPGRPRFCTIVVGRRLPGGRVKLTG